MSNVCSVTKKRPMSGHNVSHAKNKTKRRFMPNLKKRRIWAPHLKRYLTMKLSTKGLRILDKIGVEAFLAREANAAKKDSK